GPDYDTVAQWADDLMAELRAHPGFTNIETDYQQNNPQIRISVNRARAADLGVSMRTIGNTLRTMLGGSITTTFVREGEEYNVILQASAQDRNSPTDLKNLYVRSSTSGELVPLSSIVTLEEYASAERLRHYDRMRAITVSAGLANGLSLGQAIDFIDNYAQTQLPYNIQLRYDGEAREFLESGYSLYVTFLLALVIVYLVLAAQFESFIHPLIIMTTVPLAITGGLIGLWLYGGSINIFSQIGAILLVGLAAKNGVLIVEFSNQLRDRGMDFLDAIVHAAGIRLRPVLMTSMAAAFGAIPLAIATGPGSESRQAVGVVIFFGVLFSMVLTLYVVPAAYALMAKHTTSPEHTARRIAKLRKEENTSAQP
ncbi:MAG TPA: efflux RND transporter permease subunit, partial [Gammaproteobacteria bacterium]|nr:efflux RND transporter permease subunit [Gammaproteobacteria bacterium]